MEIDCGLNERIIHQFVEISTLTPAVRKLVLFGSRASGNYKYNSDIDLAFQSSVQVSSHYYFKMEEAAELYKLDLLDMDLIKEDLLVKQIQEGIVLFERKNEGNC